MSGKVLTIGVTGKDTERPTSFPTVAAAELASFLPGESCSVLETRRFYQFDAASSEARDGIRVLTPAGGGRLLMTAPAMTDAEVAAATRIATASQSGLMSAAQVMQLSAHISATANPNANHDGADTAGLGRPFYIGQTWFNSEAEILWRCVGHSTGAAKWIIANLDLQEQERFAANVSSFDYWRFYRYGNSGLTRDTINGGMSYAFSGSAYAGSAGIGTQAVGIADQVVTVNVTSNQTNISLDVYCCESYTLSLITGSTAAVLYKNGKTTQIASATMGSALSTGTHEIMIVRRGDKLIGYLDGVKVVSATDTDKQGGVSRIEINVVANGSYTAKIHSYKLFQYQK
jgi:hypothetical protein